MTYKIKELLEWYRQFNSIDLKIKTTNNEFNVNINDKSLPHLLGLHYSSNTYKGLNLYNFVKNKSDQEIYKLIMKLNPKQLTNVKNRIKYFKYFMTNLEKAELYKKTFNYSKINSETFIVKMNDNKFLHLGIATDRIDTDYLETFIVRNDDKYINNSPIKEKIVSIERYENDNLIPFSFDEVKNYKLLAEYYENKKLEKEKPSLISKIEKLSKKVAKENKQVIINKQITKKVIER